MNFAATMAAALPAARREEIVRGTGKSFILAGVNLRYRRPVTYPDTILVANTILLPLKEDRFMLRGAAYSLRQKAVVCSADQDCVSYDYQALRKCALDDDLRALLAARGTTQWK